MVPPQCKYIYGKPDTSLNIEARKDIMEQEVILTSWNTVKKIYLLGTLTIIDYFWLSSMNLPVCIFRRISGVESFRTEIDVGMLQCMLGVSRVEPIRNVGKIVSGECK